MVLAPRVRMAERRWLPVRRPILGLRSFGIRTEIIGSRNRPSFTDHRFQFSHMGIGQVALIRRRLHEVDRQCRHDEPMTSIRFAVDRKDFAVVLFDRSMQFRHFMRRSRRLQLRGGQTDRGAGRLSSAPGRPSCGLARFAFASAMAPMVGESPEKEKAGPASPERNTTSTPVG